MRIVHNNLAVFYLSILMLFLPRTAFASEFNDPCQHIKAQKAEMAKLGHSHWHIQCKPVVISLTWNMVDTFKRHGNYGTDRAKYMIEDSYQGFLRLVYDRKFKKERRLRNFFLAGPHPPDAAKLQSELRSIELSFLGCKWNGCKRFTTNQKTDFVYEPESPSFIFDWDNYIETELDNWSLAMVSSCPYPSPSLALPKPYTPTWEVLKSHYPKYKAMGGKFIDTLKPKEVRDIPQSDAKKKHLSGEYKDLLKNEGGHISPQDIKLLLKQGHFIKTFELHEKLQMSMDQVSEYSGLITVRVDLGYKKRALLLVSPDTGVQAEMTRDGITPKNKTYTLTNPGHEPLKFQIRKKEAWVSLSLNKGTLDPGASTEVIVTLTPPREKKKKCFFEDKIAFVNLTNHKGDTNRKVELAEVQHWKVYLSGFEVSELSPYYKTTTKLRKAIRMKFRFSAKFKLKRNEKCKLECEGGRIIQAKIINYELLYPRQFIKIKNKSHKKFNSVANRVGKPLSCNVEGNKINFGWGKFIPVVETTEALTPEVCKKWPNLCREDNKSSHEFGKFWHWIKEPWIPLIDGYSEMLPGADQDYGRDSKSKELSIQYTYTLKRLK
ncbi:MAG: hypothetical protein PVJ06_13415 [Desulfobacterales bacterium]